MGWLFAVPQFGNLFQPPRVNTNDPAAQIAGLGALGTTLFAGVNCFTGNCDLSVRPNVGLNFDPNTGQLAPAVSANVQVIFVNFFIILRAKGEGRYQMKLKEKIPIHSYMVPKFCLSLCYKLWPRLSQDWQYRADWYRGAEITKLIFSSLKKSSILSQCYYQIFNFGEIT